MAGRTSHPLPPHGTRERYQSRVDPCHCGDCARANAAYTAARRAALRGTPGPGGVGVQLRLDDPNPHRITIGR